MNASIKDRARERMKGFCRVCPQCDGKNCASGVPGMGGLGTGAAFRANAEALRQVRLTMRCLHGVTSPRTDTEFLGLKLSLPVLAAPIGGVSYNMGGQDVDEEQYCEAIIGGSRAAGIIGCGGDGVPDVIHKSAFASIRKAGGWGIPFVKPWEGDELNRKLDMALETGCAVVGVDVDAAGLVTLRKQGRPVSPKTPAELAAMADRVHRGGAKFMIKGVMSVADAQVALEAGVDALVVSNHGGRVLDSTPGTAEVLPRVAAFVRGRAAVLADGGVRDGVDVLKMLALGASAVLIGRPFSIAAMGGLGEGVAAYIEELRGQLLSAMTLTCCPDVASAGEWLLDGGGVKCC
ncbi:MAG: alpha-hydroxy-acid oxidizing protein [Desulfovibrionaceae bacterium]|nr:alpha-hydroxy-acid oxidizing protein [Desulfovibrionaceae bacterium]